MLIDTAITCYLVSVCAAFFTTAGAKRHYAQGLRVSVGAAWGRRLASLPTTRLTLGCCLFGICLPVLVAVFGIAFSVSGVGVLPTVQFMVFKRLWGGLYGAFVCVVVMVRHSTIASNGGEHA